MTSATFAPPPDGKVDAADLAFLLGAWGTCPCDDPYAEGLMGGGSGGEGESDIGSLGPFEGSYLGLLLEELIATGDGDLIADILALLEEWMD